MQKVLLKKMIWASFQPHFCYHFSFSPQSYLSICHQHITPTVLHLPSRCHHKATSQGASKCNLMCALPSQIRVAFHAPGLRKPIVSPNRHYLLDNWRGAGGQKKAKKVILTNIFLFICPLTGAREKG